MEKTISVNKERTTAMDCCETALLAVLIAVSGTFRIPGIVPGTEFQLSAPIAVAVCGVFGFKKYIIAGILASLMGLYRRHGLGLRKNLHPLPQSSADEHVSNHHSDIPFPSWYNGFIH